MDCSAPGFHVHHQLPKLAQTHVHQVGDAIQPSHPLLSPSPPVFNLSQNQVFPNESVLRIRWPKYWSFSVSISPSSEYLGLISFMMNWLDLLAVQKTLKSLLQNHSSKTSVLWHSALFRVQLSHPYMTTGKIIALTRWTFVGKVISLLFNMLSRLVITFLPRSQHLNFMATVTICSDFGVPQNKVCPLFPLFSHLFAMKWWDQMPWSSFSECWVLSQLFHSPLSLSSRGSLVLCFLPSLVLWNNTVVDHYSNTVGHDWVTSLSLFTFMHWRRKWQPTPVFLPGKSQRRRSLVGCCLWGCTESDMTDTT